MSVLIVDSFEVVDIEEEDAKPPAVTVHLGELRLQRRTEHAPVGQPREIIDKGETLQLADWVVDGAHRDSFREGLGGAGDLAGFIADRRHARVDGNAMPIAVAQEHVRFHRLARVDGLSNRAESITQPHALGVYVHQHVLRAPLPARVVVAEAGDPLR